MKVSLQWVRDFVDVDSSPAELADLLTHSGLEVENLTEWKPAFQGVVVARLDSFAPHPQSDHLSVCRVYDGKRDYSIVCGAPNLKAGERVALALEGARLPGGERIEKTSFQGILSEGMLCSEKELELSEDASGIMLLDSKVPLGVPLEKALCLEDWILDINVTPNRPDCLCVYGIAREIAALTGKDLRFPPIQKVEGEMEAESLTSVILERPDLCPRYVAELILAVKIAPSPFWVRRRLEAVGVRAINNIVDATNYVMMEMGQPLHAFDWDRLEERRIVVRTAEPGETFVTLDGVARPLPEDALMICDGKKPVALAGIMGGLNSEVHARTRNILLESAYFDPMGIRRTSKKMGLSTEASLRFERGIDPNGSLRAADRAAALMVEWGGGSIARGAVDNYPRPIRPAEIHLRISRTNQILGTSLHQEEIRSYLHSLQLEINSDGPDSLRVIPPTFRVDLLREIDLIEEVARLYGFHRIPVTLPSGRVAPEKKTHLQRAAERARNLLTSFGLWEVINYSFISPQMLLDLQIPPDDRRARALRIQNPLSEDQSIMRTSLIPGLLQIVRSNIHRQNLNLKFFELGKVFFAREKEELPEEVDFLSGILSGAREEESWAKPQGECDFFDLKGILEGLLEGLGIFDFQFLPDRQIPFFHPGKACRIEAQGEALGIMGEIHWKVQEIFDLRQRVYLFELDFQKISGRMAESRTFVPLPRFPSVTRDLAVMVEEEIPAGDLLRTLWEANPGLVKEIKLFDLYRGSPVPPGKKSLAFRLIYQKEDRTLTDREVNEVHQQLIQRLVEKHGGLLR